VKSYYELLEIAPTATAEEIKHAFRQQIAKYHPDKVQHLGAEFQEMAAGRAAELTQAYRTLTNAALRAEHDAELAGRAAASDAPSEAPSPEPTVQAPVAPEPAAAKPSSSGTMFEAARANRDELLRRATVARFRQALDIEFGKYQPLALPGFEVTCVPKPPMFSFRLPPRVVGRFVDRVDRAAVSEAWALAARAPKDPQRDLCVFLLGPDMAAPAELAAAIGEERRRPSTIGGKMVLVPVNTRNWTAHVPTDAPPIVRALVTRLRGT